MNQKELSKTLMMISNWTKPFSYHVLYKNNSAPKGLNTYILYIIISDLDALIYLL